MLLGWATVSLSWVLISLDLETSVANELLLDLSVMPGLMLGAIAFALGVGFAERSSAMRGESSPLTDDEGRLVPS
jgi:hypothetical protein